MKQLRIWNTVSGTLQISVRDAADRIRGLSLLPISSLSAEMQQSVAAVKIEPETFLDTSSVSSNDAMTSPAALISHLSGEVLPLICTASSNGTVAIWNLTSSFRTPIASLTRPGVRFTCLATSGLHPTVYTPPSSAPISSSASSDTSKVSKSGLSLAVHVLKVIPSTSIRKANVISSPSEKIVRTKTSHDLPIIAAPHPSELVSKNAKRKITEVGIVLLLF